MKKLDWIGLHKTKRTAWEMDMALEDRSDVFTRRELADSEQGLP